MSLPLPPFTYRSYPPYITSFQYKEGFRATAHDTLMDAMTVWFFGAEEVGDRGEPIIRLVRDAHGTIIYGRDLTPGTLIRYVATLEVLDLCRAVAPSKVDALDEMEMLVREMYVLQGKETT